MKFKTWLSFCRTLHKNEHEIATKHDSSSEGTDLCQPVIWDSFVPKGSSETKITRKKKKKGTVCQVSRAGPGPDELGCVAHIISILR